MHKMIENERRCGNCKYLGAQTGEFLDMYGTMCPLYICENGKSMYKSCLEIATGCNQFEEKESEYGRYRVGD